MRASRDGIDNGAVTCRGPGVGEWEIGVGGLRRNYGYGIMGTTASKCHGRRIPSLAWRVHSICVAFFVFFTLSIAIALVFSGEHGLVLGHFTNADYVDTRRSISKGRAGWFGLVPCSVLAAPYRHGTLPPVSRWLFGSSGRVPVVTVCCARGEEEKRVNWYLSEGGGPSRARAHRDRRPLDSSLYETIVAVPPRRRLPCSSCSVQVGAVYGDTLRV